MESIAGVFRSYEDARSAFEGLRAIGVAEDRVNLLTPGSSDDEVDAEVLTTATEQPGMGKAMGGVVGAALGAAGGLELGVAIATLLVPGVGPVLAAGAVGAALLGAGGAVAGATAGGALEGSVEGVPHDELFVYEDALRKGRTVVFASVDDDVADDARQVLGENGAESIDAARKEWWLGLRDAEKEHYESQGQNFEQHEETFRKGFEAALHPEGRGKSYTEDLPRLESCFNEECHREPFKAGYSRGQNYHSKLAGKAKH
jgi:hypothetical protein